MTVEELTKQKEKLSTELKAKLSTTMTETSREQCWTMAERLNAIEKKIDELNKDTKPVNNKK